MILIVVCLAGARSANLSTNSIASIQLTILNPSFSQRSRTGAPCSTLTGVPFISYARIVNPWCILLISCTS